MSVKTKLIDALNFVSPSIAKNEAAYREHVLLQNHFAIVSNSQLSIGHPIEEDLEACPQFDKFKAAINKCGQDFSLTVLKNEKLSVVGGKLRAVVDCLSDYPPIIPDPNIAKIDDRIKEAFKCASSITSEHGTRFIECSLLLRANDCTATDGKILMQYWHGIDLPPGLVVPHGFAAIVQKSKLKLEGFGYTENRSVTFWFENGAWIKTLLYEDKYPDIDKLLNVASSPCEVPKDLFEAMQTVGEFNDEAMVILKDGKVSSHNTDATGAQFAVDGLNIAQSFDSDLTKIIAPYVETIDLVTHEDRAMFFGKNVRGIIMGCQLHKKTQPEEVPF